MSNQLSAQVTKLAKLISDPGTLGSYQQTLAVTLNILKETAVLAWFVLCLSLVAIDWFWHSSIATGQKARTWLSELKTVDSNEIPNQVSQGMLTAGKSGISYVVAQARDQIGLPAKPEEIKTEAIKPTEVPPSKAIITDSAPLPEA
jgi:hypothetical protein